MGFSLLLEEQNKDVGKKLGIATLLMFTMPILTYYMCYHFVFYTHKEPSNWSGGAAVLVTNLIIAGYVIVAFSEPDDNDEEDKNRGNNATAAQQHDNDARHPRTGIFKQRVD